MEFLSFIPKLDLGSFYIPIFKTLNFDILGNFWIGTRRTIFEILIFDLILISKTLFQKSSDCLQIVTFVILILIVLLYINPN